MMSKLKTKGNGPQLMSDLLYSAVTAHIEHFAATGPGSFAKHMALGEYYEAIPEAVDSFVEAYQAKYGLMGLPMKNTEEPGEDFLECLQELDARVGTYQATLTKDPDLANLCQEIQAVIKSTMYKLRFLS